MPYQTCMITLANHAYPIYVGTELFKQSDLLVKHLSGKQVMIVTQKNIAQLYLPPLLEILSAYQCDVTYLPRGEKHKNLRSWQKIINHLVDKKHDRSTTLIALGGGMVGDITGFAAACYLRGVNYMQIPTTLIAQVDSAIGGKTGVNHALGKNLIGAFYQPRCVLADVGTLNSLPRRELVAGLAEVIKCGIIQDETFFAWLEKHYAAFLYGEQDVMIQAIYRAASIKGRCVVQDVDEKIGMRSLLNFGHTLGHALEALFAYQELLHGEAVAIGMNVAAELSVMQGWLDKKDWMRIQNLLSACGLPIQSQKKINLTKLQKYLARDKKNRDGRMQWVLIKRLGEAVLAEVSQADLMKLISHRLGGR